MSSTDRVRRCRQRKREQRAVLALDVPLWPTADWLVAHGFLQAWDSEDRAKIRAALEQAVRVVVSYEQLGDHSLDAARRRIFSKRSCNSRTCSCEASNALWSEDFLLVEFLVARVKIFSLVL
jgi:hypothetical protein